MKGKTLRTVMIVILCAGVALIISGIVNASKGYEAPIYISKNFTVTSTYSMGAYNFVISGKIQNRTSTEIMMTNITVLCSAPTKNNTKYTATWSEHNVVIPANGEITICGTNLVTDKKDICYDKVSKIKCSINGKEYILDYSSDGITFESTSGYITSACIGGAMCVVAIATIMLQRKLQYKY